MFICINIFIHIYIYLYKFEWMIIYPLFPKFNHIISNVNMS